MGERGGGGATLRDDLVPICVSQWREWREQIISIFQSALWPPPPEASLQKGTWRSDRATAAAIDKAVWQVQVHGGDITQKSKSFFLEGAAEHSFRCREESLVILVRSLANIPPVTFFCAGVSSVALGAHTMHARTRTMGAGWSVKVGRSRVKSVLTDTGGSVGATTTSKASSRPRGSQIV